MEKGDALKRVLRELAKLYTILDSDDDLDYSEFGIDIGAMRDESKTLAEALEVLVCSAFPGISGKDDIMGLISDYGFSVSTVEISETEEKIGSKLVQESLSSRNPDTYHHIFGREENFDLAMALCDELGPGCEFSIDDDFELYIQPHTSRVMVLVNSEVPILFSDLPKSWQEKALSIIMS